MHKSYRFIGGPHHNTFRVVLGDKHSIQSRTHPDTFGILVKGPDDILYTRRRIVMADDVSRYEETLYADVVMTDEEAAGWLHDLIADKVALPHIPYTPRPLKWLPTRESKLVKSMFYDDKEQLLDIVFKNIDGSTGKMYRYRGVPHDVVLKMLTAPSLGVAFCDLIRRGNYKYTTR